MGTPSRWGPRPRPRPRPGRDRAKLGDVVVSPHPPGQGLGPGPELPQTARRQKAHRDLWIFLGTSRQAKGAKSWFFLTSQNNEKIKEGIERAEK